MKDGGDPVLVKQDRSFYIYNKGLSGMRGSGDTDPDTTRDSTRKNGVGETTQLREKNPFEVPS